MGCSYSLDDWKGNMLGWAPYQYEGNTQANNLLMSIDGEVQEAFSGRTLDVPAAKSGENSTKECIDYSRSKYALPLGVAQEQLALSEIMSPRAMGKF
jgi:hypothetical protein